MTTIHNCRWEWCREAFDKHADLVDHIKAHMIRGRPITKKKASDILRTEGYAPEEIAARLIPGYAPASLPLNSPAIPPVPRTPQPKTVPIQDSPKTPQGSVPSQATTLNPSLAVEPPRSPAQFISTSPSKSPDVNIDLPPSSPPAASPTQLSPQHTPIRRFEDMSIDEPERGNAGGYTHILVPLATSPADKRDNAAPAPPRSNRLKRRPSFSLMSSSVSPDEFTGARYQPLPESPSVTTMLAEREKGLKEKDRERDNMRAAEKEREQQRKRETVKEGGRAGSGPSTEPTGLKAQGSWTGRGSPPRRAQNIVRFRGRGRGRGRGLNITSISTPGRTLSAGQAKPQPSVNSSGVSGHPPPPIPTISPFYQPPEPIPASQDTVEQLMSEFTHADSDEEIHANLMDNLGDLDLGLQTQAPYVPQTQESYNSEATKSRGGSQGQIPPSGSQGSQTRVRGRG